MSDLITWLRAQLDEDERVAQKCAAVGDFRWAESEDPTEPDGRVVDGQGRVVVWDDGANLSGHIARHDPARVLAGVAAKRLILDAVEHGLVGHPGPCLNYEGQDPAGYDEYDGCALHLEWNRASLGPLAARLLALPYADQPGYEEAWRP